MQIDKVLININKLTNIPVSLYFEDNQTMTLTNLKVTGKLQNIINSNKELVLNSIEDFIITRLKDFSELSYFGFTSVKHKVIFGPFLIQEASNNKINQLKRRLRQINEDSVMIDNFFSSLKIVSPDEVEYLYFSVLGNTNEHLGVTYKELEAKRITQKQMESIDTLFEELEYVKQNYDIEHRFVEVIKSGDINKALLFPTKSIMKQLPQRAQNDSLRNAKTRLTILNTLCNRAAIAGGIDIQLGHKISTNFGMIIENMDSIFDSDHLTKEIVTTYTRAVSDYSLDNFSKLVGTAVSKIRQNLTNKYSLSMLAEELFLSKEHLSRVFKKETGMSVNNYINFSKIQEAEKLLKENKYSILDISTMLGFSNSSYFSALFKKHKGISPNQYK